MLLLLSILALMSGLAGCLPPVAADPILTPAVETPAAGTDLGWAKVYFTDPGGPASKGLRGGPDRALADAIDEARVSVDLAIYELNLWSLRDALLALIAAGWTSGLSLKVIIPIARRSRP